MHRATPVDVQMFLNEHPFSRFQWTVFALCFVVALLDGFDTAAIGYAAPSLLREWGVSRSDLAAVLSAALFGLAAGALSAGVLADRWGRKRVLLGSVLGSVLGSLLGSLLWLGAVARRGESGLGAGQRARRTDRAAVPHRARPGRPGFCAAHA